MGPFERFVAGVAAAIGALATPGNDGTAPRPPAAVAAPAARPDPAAPILTPPLPRPRPAVLEPVTDLAIVAPAMVPAVPAPVTGPAATPIPAAAQTAIAAAASPAPLGYAPVERPVTNAVGAIDAFLGVGEGQPTTTLAYAPVQTRTANTAAAIDAFLGTGNGPGAGPEIALVTPVDPLPLPAAEGFVLDAPAVEIEVAALPPIVVREPRRYDNACLAQVAAIDLIATLLPPVEAGACGIATPLEIAQLGHGNVAVAMTPAATVDCRMAAALDQWMNENVQPNAERLLGQRVTGVRVMSSYSCRAVNNAATGPLSWHAHGAAIDVGAFRLADGTWVTVHPYEEEATPEAAFLAAVREQSCGVFTTVLGPGVANHDDHFHFDLAVRGRNGNAVYCR